MATAQLNGVIQHLRNAALRHDAGGLTDRQLLEAYLHRRDQSALAALIERHGPMVWGVCRRVLANHHDAEDAFQAAFVVLVRKAAAIAKPELLANWLYGVAHQTALKARATAHKRKTRETQVTHMPEPASLEQDAWSDLQPLLDQELSRLPDIYRSVLVLCELEGKTRKEAARQLGIAEGTIASRLTRARMHLAKRLKGRGVALSGAALAAALTQNVASAAMPSTVVSATMKATTGLASAKVAALAEGVVKAMLFTKLKSLTAVLLILCSVVTGAIALAHQSTPEPEAAKIAHPKPGAPIVVQPGQDDEAPFTAWGKEIGGLQAGIGFRAGEKRAYKHGEILTLVVRIRNVSKKAVKFEYVRQYLDEVRPIVTDAAGKTVSHPSLAMLGFHVPEPVTLAPGQQIELESRMDGKNAVRHLLTPIGGKPEEGKFRAQALYATGKVTVHYDSVLGNSSSGAIEIAPELLKLGTGKLDLEVQDPPKDDKNEHTAWGEPIGGVQAGLGFRPGEHRAYHHGETVTLVVRVRNVGTQEVKIQIDKELTLLKLPTMTDGAKNAVRLGGEDSYGSLARTPKQANLAPGTEIQIGEWKAELRPPNEQRSEKPRSPTLYGTGKFQLQYKQLTHDDGDPILSKLPTGKLELEVKTGPPPQKPKNAAPDDEEKAVRAYVEELRAAVKVGGQQVYNVAIRPEFSKSVLWAAKKGEDALVIELYQLYTGYPQGAVQGGTALTWAARHNDAETVKILLDRGLDVDAADAEGWTALHQAIRWGPHNVDLLLKKDAKVNVKTKKGVTPLMLAAQAPFPEVVTMLLEKKAEVNAKDADERAPLMYAARGGRPASVKALLANGADVHAKDKAGRTALAQAQAPTLVRDAPGFLTRERLQQLQEQSVRDEKELRELLQKAEGNK